MQVEGDSRWFSGRSDFGIERYELSWIRLGDGEGSETGAMIVVKMGDQMSFEEEAEGADELDLAT